MASSTTASTTNSSMALTTQNVTLPLIEELHDPNFLDRILPPSQAFKAPPIASGSTTPTNAMMDALKASADRTYTLNNSPAFSSTDSPSLDAFLQLSSWIGPDQMATVLTKSWAEDPQLTLRNIWYLRSIHDGKSEKEAFYIAFGWLLRNHPRTAIVNLPELVRSACVLRKDGEPEGAHGYWKDLLNILALATQDALETLTPAFLHAERTPFKHGKPQKKSKATSQEEKAARIAAAAEYTARQEAEAKVAREKRLAEAHALLLVKLKQPVYRALYIAVARLFAEQLAADYAVLRKMEEAKTEDERKALRRQLSLAGKWAPSGGRAADRVTNIMTAIAQLMLQPPTGTTIFPALPKAASDPHVQRSFLQRWLFAPLRATLLVPESFMSNDRWSKIIYPRVPSLCMALNAPLFAKHDAERFEGYLKEVAEGKKSIAGATMLPHELVQAALVYSPRPATLGSKNAALSAVKRRVSAIQAQVVEGQWKAVVTRLRETGALDGAIAVCDVSGSMGSLRATEADLKGKYKKRGPLQPIFPSVALSLLTARLAKPPFNDGFVTFSATPEFVRVDPSLSLAESVRMMERQDWGMNTDFIAVFRELLLPLAIQNRVLKEDMIKRLFVFSDMQFDEAKSEAGGATVHWETAHDAVRREYEAAGYDLPEIVYWDLSSSGQYEEGPGKTVPMKGDAEGVSMLSGFSSGMMKVFLGEEEMEVAEAMDEETKEEGWEDVQVEGAATEAQPERKRRTPVETMKKALGVASFDGLVVVD